MSNLAVDIKKIIRDFDLASSRYEENALLQKQVANKLAEIAISHMNDNVLDIGCGTGFIRSSLASQGFKGSLHEMDISFNMCQQAARKGNSIINADVNKLPFRADFFEGAISSLALQWVDEPNNVFKALAKTLKKDSFFCFSIFGDKTLQEFNKSFQNIQEDGRVNRFYPVEKITQALNQNYKNISVVSETKKHSYKNIYDLGKKIRLIGARNKDSRYIKKSAVVKAQEYYSKNYATEEGIYASWEILYFKAQKA